VGFPALESFIERLVMLVCVEAEEIFRMEGAAEYASAQQWASPEKTDTEFMLFIT
jgi:hypothetical protein